jgi:hypothetical protein
VVREIVEQLVGRWQIQYPDARGTITPDAPLSVLELRADGTYWWPGSPDWSPGTGRWKVLPEEAGQYWLGLEESDWIFKIHELTPGSGSNFRPSWDWRNLFRPAPLGALLFRATWSP